MISSCPPGIVTGPATFEGRPAPASRPRSAHSLSVGRHRVPSDPVTSPAITSSRVARIIPVVEMSGTAARTPAATRSGGSSDRISRMTVARRCSSRPCATVTAMTSGRARPCLYVGRRRSCRITARWAEVLAAASRSPVRGFTSASRRDRVGRSSRGGYAGSRETHNQFPVNPGAPPAGAGRLPVDIFEYAFDRVSAMGVETARLTPLPRWRHDEGPVPDAGMLPVLPALRELLPGGLRRGTVVAVGGWGLLCLAVAAGAWCAAVGLPHLGVAAAAEAGLDPGRLLLVPDPGARWPQVVASLLDGCELILLRPPGRPSAQVRTRLAATLRRCGGVLVAAGGWEGAQARLLVARQEWAGIGAGHGRLRARRVQVVADGRGVAARSLTRWLWLPGPDGSVDSADRLTTPAPDMRETG